MFFFAHLQEYYETFYSPTRFLWWNFHKTKEKNLENRKFPQCKLCVFSLPLLWKQKILRDQKKTNKTTWVASQNACLSLEKYTFRQPFH
jgi:hypothetical protein